MPQDILTINQGSSSLKFALFEECPPDRTAPETFRVKIWIRGEIDDIHQAPEFCVRDEHHHPIVKERWKILDSGHEAALTRLLSWLRDYRGVGHLAAAGHRVVHGGTGFSMPVVVDE